ncbi:hypothetical protein BH23ACT12_BH23ACT12_15370 [soil metagenome]
MSEDTTQVEDAEEVEEIEPVSEAAKMRASDSKIHAKPVKGDVDVDFTDLGRETLKPRVARDQKVFTNGFKIPGFSGYTDIPGKICVDCGWRAMKFSKECAKCGGELRPE